MLSATGTTSSGPSSGPSPDGGVLFTERIAKGFVLFILAFIVLIAGYIGYVKYDEFVEPNLPLFVCCVPSVLIAAVLIFFALARRWTVVRRVSRPPPGFEYQKKESKDSIIDEEKSSGGSTRKQGAKKIHRREITTDDGDLSSGKTNFDSQNDILRRKKNLIDYMADLDEQFQEGLLMEESYRSLKNKSSDELRELESLILQRRTPRKK